MHYTGFRFKNFKGIERMTLDLTGDVTTLIGLNESGKTTILEAIFCFSYGAENLEAINPGMASLRVPDQWIPIARRANFNDTIEICGKVELSVSDRNALQAHLHSRFGLRTSEIQSRIDIEEKYRFENSRYTKTNRTWSLRIKGTKGKERNPRDYRADSAEWQGAIAFLKSRLPKIWYFPNFLFELPERFRLSETDGESDQEERDKNRFYRATFEQVLAELGSGANLETHLIKRVHSDERTDKRNLNSLLLDMGRVITTTIMDGWGRIFGRPPVAQEVELAIEPEDTSAALELRIKGSDGYYDLSERSLGFRWFFMFLLMTSFHERDSDGSRPLFLLDEPASNLHSTAQAELLKSFENLIETCNLVYTTHSQHLINVRWLDAAYVVKNSALGSLDFSDYLTTRMATTTSVSATHYRRFVAEHPDQTSYFQPVLDLLDYRPSILEPVPRVVLVEGKSDYYLLRYAIDVLELPTNLHLVPGTGAGALGPLIQLHLGWGKEFLVLLDGDEQGVAEQQRYEQTFGPVLKHRCVVLPTACGDSEILEAEDLLTDTDKTAVIDAAFDPEKNLPRPKKALSRAVIEVYASSERVQLEQVTMKRLAALLAGLESRLALLV